MRRLIHPVSGGANVSTVGGWSTLTVDGEAVARGRIEKTLPGRFSLDESFDVGADTGTGCSPDYEDELPFTFTGKSTFCAHMDHVGYGSASRCD